MSAPVLQACLNGARAPGDHPALPVSPDELAADAARCWEHGAHSVHVHPRDAAGVESLSPGAVAEAVAAIRVAVPEIEISVTTGGWIEPDLERRVHHVRSWTVSPDVASVNFSEEGAESVCEALWQRGIEIEAGLAGLEDAERFLASPAVRWSRRVLVEVPDRDPRAAVDHARRIDEALGDLALPRLHHGEEVATWAVIAAGARLARAIRIGLEDTLVLPDGSPAPGNDAMVRAGNELQRRALRASR